ncbi:hypothetical protein [Brucella anthropi]|uniref:hypothetical protein n=1 Tax=Brucella anthropi TaxID=529 RepID=UPI003EE3D272
MAPIAVSEPKAKQVDMLVATTRRPSDDPALRYSGERGEDVRLDNIVVSIPPAKAREIGKVQWPDTAKPNPLQSFATTKANLLQEDQVMPWFRKASRGKKRVLICAWI